MRSLEAIIKLFEPRYLLLTTIILIGALFFLVAATDGNISIKSVSISLDQNYDNVLFNTGIIFFVVAFFLVIVSTFISSASTVKEKKISQELNHPNANSKLFLDQQQQISDLNAAIKNIDQLTSKQDDFVSENIQKILHSISRTLIENQSRPKRLDLLIGWIEENQDDWVKRIPRSAYRKVKWYKQRLFFSELESHINLLKKNIAGGKYGSPRKLGIPRHIADPTPYINSLSELERLATKDLEKIDPNVLGGSERATFFRYLQRLIKNL